MTTTLRPTDRQVIRRTVLWLNEYVNDCDDKHAEHVRDANLLAEQLTELVNRNDEKKEANQNGTRS